MNRNLIIVIVIALLVVIAIIFANRSDESPTQPVKHEPVNSLDMGGMMTVTAEDNMYHKATCPNIHGNTRLMTRQDAVSSGAVMCPTCITPDQ